MPESHYIPRFPPPHGASARRGVRLPSANTRVSLREHEDADTRPPVSARWGAAKIPRAAIARRHAHALEFNIPNPRRVRFTHTIRSIVSSGLCRQNRAWEHQPDLVTPRFARCGGGVDAAGQRFMSCIVLKFRPAYASRPRNASWYRDHDFQSIYIFAAAINNFNTMRTRYFFPARS